MPCWHHRMLWVLCWALGVLWVPYQCSMPGLWGAVHVPGLHGGLVWCRAGLTQCHGSRKGSASGCAGLLRREALVLGPGSTKWCPGLTGLSGEVMVASWNLNHQLPRHNLSTQPLALAAVTQPVPEHGVWMMILQGPSSSAAAHGSIPVHLLWCFLEAGHGSG